MLHNTIFRRPERPLTRAERRDIARNDEHRRRGHGLSAPQLFAVLAPRLHTIDPKTKKRVRTNFRNVIEDGRHV